MCIYKLFFNRSRAFKVISMVNEGDKVILLVTSRAKESICPNCELPSKKIHSYYNRKLTDLPVLDKKTFIHLKARKFYCSTLECPLKIFTERFKSFFSSFQRRSDRLTQKLLNLVIRIGGKPAEKTCKDLNIPISDTSLLRIITKQELPPTTNITHLGVDDWAIRKRERYGSILVDLTTNRPIGLLKDREENTLKDWLLENKQIQLISRDRYINYQKASTLGAPEAIQVADRWHLLKNLGESVRKVLDRECVVIKKMREQHTVSQPKKKKSNNNISNNQLERFAQVKSLLAQGQSHRKISEMLHMSRVTVKKYEMYDQLPSKNYQNSTGISKHLDYIKLRLEQKPTIMLKELHSELKDRGYKRAYNTLSDTLNRFQIPIGKALKQKFVLPSNLVFWRPSRAMMLFMAKQEKMTPEDLKILKEFCELSPNLTCVLQLVREFRVIMFEQKCSVNLDLWIDKVNQCGIAELQSFAKGLLKDIKAIYNAIDLPWSNGPVEGNVNKLKTLKRQMYGRCSIELLEKRMVLLAD